MENDIYYEYVSCIVDECGTVVAKASEVDVNKLLEEHPEWTVRCI